MREGEVFRFEGFVIKGCLRVFAIDPNGYDHVLYFALTLPIILIIVSFFYSTALACGTGRSSTDNHGAYYTIYLDNNSNDGTAKTNDKVIHACSRESGNAVLAAGFPAGTIAEMWMGFVGDDEQLTANSVYTGQLAI